MEFLSLFSSKYIGQHIVQSSIPSLSSMTVSVVYDRLSKLLNCLPWEGSLNANSLNLSVQKILDVFFPNQVVDNGI